MEIVELTVTDPNKEWEILFDNGAILSISKEDEENIYMVVCDMELEYQGIGYHNGYNYRYIKSEELKVLAKEIMAFTYIVNIFKAEIRDDTENGYYYMHIQLTEKDWSRLKPKIK